MATYFFVPQDVPALIETIGEKNFVERLNWGFEVSKQWRYNAPNDQYWDYPVVQGNQQSMHLHSCLIGQRNLG